MIKFIKKPIIIISLLSLLLFVLWFIKTQEYEPVIGIIVSIGTIVRFILIERKSIIPVNRITYSVQIRGYNERDLEAFIKKVTNDNIELTGYKYTTLDGDWYNVLFESKSRIKLKEFYQKCIDLTSHDGVKIYEVEGDNKIFGLLDGEGPAQYL